MSFPFALATLLSRSTARPKLARVRRSLGAESLEDRRLLTITVTFQTSLGNFDVELYDQQAPLTVQNFLNYVRDNDYDGSIFHRSVPGFVVQGGGFKTDFSSVPADPAVQNEPGISNTRGTIAMAKLGGNPNSATNQWFFNLADNSSNLDNQNGGFTVFGKVLGNGMQIVDAIAALPTTNRGGAFTNLPVRNYSGTGTPTADQLVVVTDIAVQGGAINGTVFQDANNNAQRDGAEAGVSGWTVFIDANNDGVQNSGEQSAQTDSNGAYRFSGLQAGTYVVRSVQRVGWARTTPAAGFYSVTLGVGESAPGRDFGQVPLGAPTTPDLLDASDTGSSATDNLTRLNNETAAGALSFQLSGLVPGAKVELFSGSTKIGELTATGTTATIVTNGSAKLADGANLITAAQSLGGVNGSASSVLIVTIDAKAPAVTSTAGTLAAVGSAYTYDAASDDDANAPVYSLIAAPSGMTIDAATGLVAWTPAVAQVGAQSFTLRVTDKAGNTKDQSVNLTVRPPNHAPTGAADSYTLDEDQVLQIPVAQGVLVNDHDQDEDPITAVLVTGPAHGALQLAADGSFKYTPAANYNGNDSFTYRVSDGVATSDPITVTFTVNPMPDVPAGVADSYNVNEDGNLDPAAAVGVLANDSNPDGLSIEALLVNGPTHGEFTFRPDGSFTYIPAANYNGPDSFTYRLKFGDQQTDPITVSLTVVSVNDPPIAGNDAYSLKEDETLTVALGNGLLKNDSDPVEQSPLTALLVTEPQHGTLQFRSDGSFTYKPNANYNGTDSFTYRANDGSGNSDLATVTLTITPLPDNPIAQADAYTVAEDGQLVVAAANGVLKNDNDPDGEGLRAVKLSDPASGKLSFNADGSFKYVPAANFNGSVQFTYKVAAGSRESAPVTVTINVTAVNDAPVAHPDTYTLDEDTHVATAAFDGVLGNDKDVDTQVLSAVLVHGPSHGQLILNPDGSFSYLPSPNFNGTDTFTYRANDGSALSDEVAVTLVVRPVEDPIGVSPVEDQQSLAGSPVAFTITATDPDTPNQQFLYSLGAGAPSGATIDSQTGAVSWLVPADASGEFDIPVIVEAGGRTAEQVVRVSVLNLGGVVFSTAQLTNAVADVAPASQPAVNQQLLAASLLTLEYNPLPPIELDNVEPPSPLDRIQSGDYVVEDGEVPEDLRTNQQNGAGGRQRVQRPVTPPEAPAKGASLPQGGSSQQGPRQADLREATEAAKLTLMLQSIEAAANRLAPAAAAAVSPSAPLPAAALAEATIPAAEPVQVSASALPLALAALASTEVAKVKSDRRRASRNARIDQSRTSLGRWCRIE
ncbi:MAG: Ig-like domain-containing protein [Pirellulales bacterium]